MENYDLISYKDPLLLEEMPAFDFKDPIIDPDKLCNIMLSKMNEGRGIGLSANQLGIKTKVFCMRGEPNFVCFNPRIVHMDEEQELQVEGCLSFPGLFAKVPRSTLIRVRFQTPSGASETRVFMGLTARVFQHETDHLNGKVFFRNLSKMSLQMAIKKAKKNGFTYFPIDLNKFLEA